MGITLLAFVFVLGILVFVHEFGHFILAKLVGIRVERFSLGFPPRLIGKKIGETDYCISLIPIGGYVKLSGMIDESLDKSSIKGEPWEFMSKPIYQRFLVILAGPVMNLLLALLVFSVIAFVSGISEPVGPTVGKIKPASYAEQIGLQHGDLIIAINNQQVNTWEEVFQNIKNQEQVLVSWKRGNETISKTINSAFVDSIDQSFQAVVGDVIDNLPAETIGLKEGDKIIRINDQPINTWTDLTEIIYPMAGKEITIEWQREGQIYSARTTPIKDQTDGKGKIGIGLSTVKKQAGLFYSIYAGFNFSVNLTKLVYKSLKLVFSGEVPFKDAFAGPVRIAKMAGESARSGAKNLFFFMAFLSLNLGYINLMPIPVLDGGHIIFLMIEGIIRRPISNKTKLVIQQIGMALLLALMVLIIINDIRR